MQGPATLNSSPSISIAAGATLDATQGSGCEPRHLHADQRSKPQRWWSAERALTATAATITPLSGGSLTVGGLATLNAGTVLNLGIGDNTQQLLVTTGMTINGAVKINVPLLGSVSPTGGANSDGFYQIINANTAITNPNNLSLAAVTVRGEALDTTAAATTGVVNVSVGAANALTWVGGGTNQWNVNSSKNWNNTNTSAADVFYNMDTVTFDDTSANKTVTLVGSLAPTGTAGYTFPDPRPPGPGLYGGGTPSMPGDREHHGHYTFAGTGSIIGAPASSSRRRHVEHRHRQFLRRRRHCAGARTPLGIVSIHQGTINVTRRGADQ